jgi:hypothetical protein
MGAGAGVVVDAAGTQEGMSRRRRRERKIRLDMDVYFVDKNIPFLSKERKGILNSEEYYPFTLPRVRPEMSHFEE